MVFPRPLLYLLPLVTLTTAREFCFNGVGDSDQHVVTGNMSVFAEALDPAAIEALLPCDKSGLYVFGVASPPSIFFVLSTVRSNRQPRPLHERISQLFISGDVADVVPITHDVPDNPESFKPGFEWKLRQDFVQHSQAFGKEVFEVFLAGWSGLDPFTITISDAVTPKDVKVTIAVNHLPEGFLINVLNQQSKFVSLAPTSISFGACAAEAPSTVLPTRNPSTPSPTLPPVPSSPSPTPCPTPKPRRPVKKKSKRKKRKKKSRRGYKKKKNSHNFHS